MSRLVFSSQALAQSFADDVHANMITQNSEYAKSAASGQTLRWAFPYLESGAWYVNIKARCVRVLTGAERRLVLASGEFVQLDSGDFLEAA